MPLLSMENPALTRPIALLLLCPLAHRGMGDSRIVHSSGPTCNVTMRRPGQTYEAALRSSSGGRIEGETRAPSTRRRANPGGQPS